MGAREHKKNGQKVWIKTITHLQHAHYEKKGVLQATHYIYTPWVLTDKLHELHSWNSPYIQCNSITCQNNTFSTTV
jgi:hypothetical protein